MLTFLHIRLKYQLFILEGRQYGRGKTGGQVRDEYRTDYDPGRGGYGKRNEDATNRKRLVASIYKSRLIRVKYDRRLRETTLI